MMLNEPDWSAIFAPSGRLLREGETIRRQNLSRTLYTIAEQGPDAFYKGAIADAFLDKVRSTGGIMTREDMEGYEVKVSRALQGTYRGKKIYTPHAPTSGPVLIHMLNLMEHYEDFVEEGRTVLNAHRFLEAMKCTLIYLFISALADSCTVWFSRFCSPVSILIGVHAANLIKCLGLGLGILHSTTMFSIFTTYLRRSMPALCSPISRM